MASGFAPEFLILLGIDIFLGASILTVLLEKHFPGSYPYILEGAALIGFAELMSGPSFLTSLSVELQFWYSFVYAMIAVLALFATNLYLLFLRRRTFESAVLGICGTVPAGLGILYFTSAFVNGLTVSLPLVPVIPIEGVYAMFGLSIGLVVFSLVVFGRRQRGALVRPRAEERPVEEPVPAQASGSSQVVLVSQTPAHLAETGPEVKDAPSASPPPVTAPSFEASPALGPNEGRSGTPQSDMEEPKKDVTLPSPKPEQSRPAPSDGTPERAPTPHHESVTALIEKKSDRAFRKRLVESIRFFDKAVDHPVRLDASALSGILRGANKAYLTPAGMILAEDSAGRPVSLSLSDLPAGEALKIMKEAMKGLEGVGGLP